MSHRALRLIAAALLLTPLTTLAGLLDRGPASTTTGYPTWYRDGQPGAPGTPVQLCITDTQSRLAPPPDNELCFPVGPGGIFPGSRGDENFYFLAGAAVGNPANGFSARLDLALEAAYGGGPAVFGDEMVFARVRVTIDTPAAGTYLVRHPYGTLRFDDVPAGSRAVTFTEDIGLTVRNFDEALAGKIGPFLQWDADQADLVYTFTGRPTEVFLGDPNIPHTVTGSPIGFNRFEVEYLGVADLDGAGGSIAATDLFSVLGQKFTDSIPVPLKVTRSLYSASDAPSDNVQLDVWAEIDSGAGLYLSSDVTRTIEMTQAAADPGTLLRRYQASLTHTGSPPGAITVSSIADPLSYQTRALTDEVTGARASWDPVRAEVAVSACSSDRRLGAVSLFADGVALAPDAAAGAGCFSGTIAGVVFPPVVAGVSSTGGGSASAGVTVASAPSLPPTSIAVSDGPFTVDEGAAPTALPVGANDVDPASPGVIGGVVVLTGPAHGTAAGGAGEVLYAPAPFYFGPDRFTYAFVDASGHLSNAAEVLVDVLQVNDAPSAGADTGAVANRVGQSVTIAVLANDVDPEGQPLSVAGIGTAPANGTATVNADGTITYQLTTALAVAPGADTFTYVVTDGVASAVGTVTITVSSAEEALAIIRAEYVSVKLRWRIEGTSSFPGPGNAVTLYSGTQLLATNVPVDAAGIWAYDSGQFSPVLPASPATVTAVSTGGATATASVRLK